VFHVARFEEIMAKYLAQGRLCEECGEWIPMISADWRKIWFGKWLCDNCWIVDSLGERDIE